jgi:flagellar biosynthesis protein FlhF
MNIKRFVAKNAQEALRMVKKEMGEDAVILKTRTLDPEPGDSVERGGRIEVTAAIDYDAPSISFQKGDHTGAREMMERYGDMAAQVKEIKALLWSIEAGTVLKSEPFFDHSAREQYACFKGFGLRGHIIRSLMEETMAKIDPKDENTGQEPVKQCLVNVLKKIKTGGPRVPGQSIQAFIGPTGVGKTTTLAKLAARSAIGQGRSVALITVDTYRIAAVKQLETYARIMGVPMEVASSRGELRKAVEKHCDKDHIFVDTVGRSPRDSREIGQLMEMLKIPQGIHSYLVLSATTDLHQLLLAEKTFNTLLYKSYIFTKLDEVEDASPMVNFLLSQNRPVSYFTMGQRVPEDLEPASKKTLAKMILSGKNVMLDSPGYGVH